MVDTSIQKIKDAQRQKVIDLQRKKILDLVKNKLKRIHTHDPAVKPMFANSNVNMHKRKPIKPTLRR